jgi:hypothetical protein
MNIYEKLNEARAKFHQLKLTKTGENTFAKYKYFELGDFLIPGLQVMREVGLCPLPVTFDKDGMARMQIVDTAKPEDRIVFESPMGSAALKGCHEVQNIGAVETYQRRYLWVAALEIVEHDALDATTGKDSVANGGSVHHAVRDGIGDDLPAEDKQFLKELGQWCTVHVAKGEAVQVAQHVAAQNLEADQRTYLENQMDSKTRAAIKKAEAEIRAAFGQRKAVPA